MRTLYLSKQKGFTVTELMVVFVIITFLTLVIFTNIQIAKSRGRDSQIRSDKQKIILALVKARNSAVDYIYPGVAGWQCLKSSGTCFQGSGGSSYSGNTTIGNALAPFFSGGAIPRTPASSGEYMYDSYLYNPNVLVGDALVSGVTGPVLLWYQEKPIQTSDCSGVVVQPNYDPGKYYCFEKLPN